MHSKNTLSKIFLTGMFLVILLASACGSSRKPSFLVPATLSTDELDLETATPFPTRPVYEPGTLVTYIAQTGDSLPALAARFNTTVDEIREANPDIPVDATTMPPGMPIQIPIYYQPLWGTDFQILPDSAFIYGSESIDLDIEMFVESAPGWFKSYTAFSQGRTISAAEMIDWVAKNYSISPKVLLALVEYQTGALTNPERQYEAEATFLGHDVQQNRGVYLQISYVANRLNDGYYKYRTGELISFEHLDGKLEYADPWQNAATFSLQYYFSRFYDYESYLRAIGPNGFARTYTTLFGDPWQDVQAHIPGSLTQPEFSLPFESGKTWAYTGGPHTGWGSLAPWAAIDFAPPSGAAGCIPSDEFVTTVAAGVVARTGPGIVILDLDGDGDERTGWVIFYLHIAADGMVPVGTKLEAGDRIGHPSCEGGTSTGTHVHIARKYNGEWFPADGLIPFNLSGWVARNGFEPYKGTLIRNDLVVIANTNPDSLSFITAGE